MRIVLSITIALLTSLTCHAVAGINGNFTIKSGDYAIDISGKYKYCITRIIYDEYAIGNSKGFYGTILAPKTTKFIGAGHTEGGIEDVKSIEVIVDGQPQSITLNAVFEGNKIEFKKVSQLDKLLVFMTITLDEAGIKIEKNYEALADQKVFSLYVFQFCWSNETDQWMIGRPDGTIGEGRFNSDMGWHLRSERELYWYALFNSAKDKGILGYFANYYSKQGQYMWWDKNIYHKFYYWAATPKVIPKGTMSRKYSMILKGFKGTNAAWKAKAKAIAAQLENKYPLPGVPETIKFDFEKTAEDISTVKPYKGKISLQLTGNGKYAYKKLPLTLKEDQLYSVSFAIKKDPAVSRGGSDNYLIVGQHDKKRKFAAFISLGGGVARDNKWHIVTGKFKTPASIGDPNVYIYNKRTKASIWIDELEIKQIK
jgi:hypothetical protein